MPAILISLLFFLTPLCFIHAEELDPIPEKNLIRVVADVWQGDTNADGTGAYYDLLRLVFEPIGFTIRHKVFPMRRGIATINLGEEADILLADWGDVHLTRGQQYQMDRILLPTMPISQEYVLAVFPPGSDQSWPDIQKDPSMRVSWVTGYNYHRHLKLENHNITRISNSSQGIKMLYKRHLDCFFDDKTEIDQVLGKGQFKDASLRMEIVMKRHLFPVFHNNALGKKLRQLYDQRMAELVKSGEIFSFYRGYGKEYGEIMADEIDPIFPD